jgi:hypothetical protein
MNINTCLRSCGIAALVFVSLATTSLTAAAQDKPEATTASAPANIPISLAKTLNVKEKLTKTIKFTAKQTERLNIIFTAQGTTIGTAMTAMGDGFGSELTAKISQDYAEELGKIQLLPEDEREAANVALMKKAVPVVFDPIASKTKKDAFAGLRQSFILMFKQIDGVVTTAQKPQLEKIKKQFYIDFDKEMPKFLDGIFEDMKKEMLNAPK